MSSLLISLVDKLKTPEEKAKEYNKEYRKQMYLEEREEEEKKKEKEKKKKEPVKKETSMYNKEGELRQCNEGRYPFTLKEYDDPEYTYFELTVPKFMSTELLDVNVFPNFVSVRVKGKLTQIRLWEEVIVSSSEIQRAMTTGKLHITMKKFKRCDALFRVNKREKEREEEEARKKEGEKKRFGTLHLTKKDPTTSFYGNVQQVKEVKETVRERLEKEKELQKMIDEDEDLDDLPDLE